MCGKPDVVDMVHSALSSSVIDSCDYQEDLEQVMELYSEYCNMNNGTSTFAPIGKPPGDSK